MTKNWEIHTLSSKCCNFWKLKNSRYYTCMVAWSYKICEITGFSHGNPVLLFEIPHGGQLWDAKGTQMWNIRSGLSDRNRKCKF